MLVAIVNFLFFFGGILFYSLDLITFRSTYSSMPRILSILKFCVACIPVAGFVMTTSLYVVKICLHRKSANHEGEFLEPVVRNNALNRFLFNDVDWTTYDNKN